jgi:cytoskeleton protein RodZ
MGAAAVVPVPAADLVLSFDIESWIEIKDADGRVLVVGTERPGSTRAVEGRGPFSLIIGNAPGVRLSYRGRPVNLEPHTQRGIARLVVE